MSEMNEYTPDLFELIDEEGNKKQFELIDVAEIEGEQYFAMLPAVEERAEGEEDDEDGQDVRPDVGDTRGGGDGVVLWDEALAREGIEDCTVGLQGSVACTDDHPRHGEGVGYVEPEDVDAVHEHLVQLFRLLALAVEEHRVGVGMEELAEGFGGFYVEDFCLTVQQVAPKRVVQGDELLTADWWIGDGVVMRNDEVEADLEEVVVEPLADERLHLAELLRCLGPVHAFCQVGLASEPIAHDIFVGIIGGSNLERVAHTIEGFGIDVFRVEPAEVLLQAGLRAEACAVELQRRLFAHLFSRREWAGECCCHCVALADLCLALAEGVDVQAFRHGLRPAVEVLAKQGVALLFGHYITVGDLAGAVAIPLDDGVHQDIRLIAGREEQCHAKGGQMAEGKWQMANGITCFHRASFLIGCR